MWKLYSDFGEEIGIEEGALSADKYPSIKKYILRDYCKLRNAASLQAAVHSLRLMRVEQNSQQCFPDKPYAVQRCNYQNITEKNVQSELNYIHAFSTTNFFSSLLPF